MIFPGVAATWPSLSDRFEPSGFAGFWNAHGVRALTGAVITRDGRSPMRGAASGAASYAGVRGAFWIPTYPPFVSVDMSSAQFSN